MERDLLQVQEFKPKKPLEVEDELEREKELADIVYIFISPDKPGIRFYDRTPSAAETKITGNIPEGKFITDTHSISVVSWDSTLNSPNTSNKIMTRRGEVVIKTIMVTEKQFNLIASEILRPRKDERIVIDTIERKMENEINKENLKELREQLLFGFEQFNNIDSNTNNLSSGPGNFVK